MSRLFISIVFLFSANVLFGQAIQPFLSSNGTQTATVKEVQDFYNYWLSSSTSLHAGLSKNINFQDKLQCYELGANAKQVDSNFVTLFINNAIHAGEPDGVDATMLLVNDYMSGKLPLPKHVRIIILPFYNINGMLARNSTTRANQNGPLEYGFRANGQYLDLNRDMMKADAIESNFMQEILLRK